MQTLLVLLLTVVSATDVSWEEHVISTALNGAQSVFAIDLDNDNDIDVLSASNFDDKIAWYEHDLVMSWTEHVISTECNSAERVFAIDLDNDNDIDVLSACNLDDKISWYENDGSAMNWTEHVISNNANGAPSVFAIDIDNDNDIDALSASQNMIAWHEHGSGTNWTQHVISTNVSGAFDVFAIDLDNDNDIDVLSASAFDDKIAWYENNGSTTPSWNEYVIATNVDGAQSVFAIDVDNDNDIDVLSASWNDDTIAWYENDGSTTPIWTQHVISSNAIYAASVFGIDIDNDNDIDVISASTFYDKIAWYENDGSTTPSWTEHVISTNADGATSVFAIDVDNDNDIDVLSASWGDDTIRWFENLLIDCPADYNSDGVVGASDLAVLLGGWGANSGLWGDFNGDEVVDAADLLFLLANWGPC